MTRFCTRCATPATPEAAFCEECGHALRQSASHGAIPAAAPAPAGTRSARLGTKRAVLGAAVVMLLAGATAAIVWWQAPESPSAAAFARAINVYYAANAKARDDLLCVANLPYAKPTLRIAQYDSRSRRWLDSLAKAGLYTATVEKHNAGWFSQIQHMYAVTDRGKQTIRDGRLCLGTALRVQSAGGFDRIHDDATTRYALASVQLTMDEAPWLASAAEREAILDQADKRALSANLPVTLMDGRWQVPADPALFAAKLGRNASPAQASVAPVAAMLAAFKGLFTKNPALGTWRVGTRGDTIEFTSTAVIEGGNTTPVEYKIDGQTVQVTFLNRAGRFELVMAGKDIAILNGMIKLERAR